VEELLVITEATDHMTAREQLDLAQSAAQGAVAVQQRASDILAERLPGLNDPNALADPIPGQKPVTVAAALPAIPPPLHPPPALHADHYTPAATPPAASLTPGQAIVDPKYAPAPKSQVTGTTAAKTTAESKVPTSKTPAVEGGKADTGIPAKPKHPATSSAVPGDPAKPKAPKTAVPQPPEPAEEPPATTGSGPQPQ
jgi:rod shape-determining protein MreC